ncbi:nucleotidyltransferase domain-containing protein [Candidatus Micrarchaeota archaeon]|nr:nucleotidyltransferase domain-containing protein [Candidatus Micrarchaeota archaeon]
MGEEKHLMRYLKEFKKVLEKKLGSVTLILFGSSATGKAKAESDVDLIIVSKKFSGKKLHQRPRGLWLAWRMDKPVDFICLTPAEFDEKSGRTTIVHEALKHGITI